MKRIGVTGSKGKLGSLLIQRPNFFALDCDITEVDSIMEAKHYFQDYVNDVSSLDVIVNCAGISSIDECEKDSRKAILVNKIGLQNLHKVFGSRVLNISSDHVFNGKNWYLPSEDTKITPYSAPLSAYGLSKWGAEIVSKINGGKTIRLSRAVSIGDVDIDNYLGDVRGQIEIEVPTFFHRNYIHREFAVDGIEYMANNWDSIKFDTVHYASTDNWSMYLFMHTLVDALGLDSKLVVGRNEYFFDAPRPKRGGLKVALAKKLGFPMYSVADTISKLVDNV